MPPKKSTKKKTTPSGNKGTLGGRDQGDIVELADGQVVEVAFEHAGSIFVRDTRLAGVGKPRSLPPETAVVDVVHEHASGVTAKANTADLDPLISEASKGGDLL